MVRLIVVLGILLFPALAATEELEFEFGASGEYDSNVFRSTNDEQGDFVFRFYPGLTLFKDEGDLRYRLRYVMPFEQGVKYGDDISDFDYILTFNSSWIYNEANEFFLTNNFRYDRSTTRRFQQDASVPDVSSARRRVLTNRTTLGLNHAFSPRTTGGLSFSYDYFDTEQRNRQDNQTFAATTDVNYSLNPKSQVGTGFSFTVQDFKETAGVPGSQTYFYNLFGSWVYQFDETTSLSLSVGPTVIQNQQDSSSPAQTVTTTPTTTSGQVFDFDSCTSVVNGFRVLTSACDPFFGAVDPTLITVSYAPEAPPPSVSDVTVTAFGNFNLTRRWTPTISSTLSYRRNQSNASGLGGSTVLDALTLRSGWELNQWWDLSGRFDFTHRESVTTSSQSFLIVQNVGGVATAVPAVGCAAPPGQGLTSEPLRNAIQTNRWGVSGRLARKIGRRAEASLRLVYNEQDSQRSTRGRASDFSDFLAIVGVRYRFEPITLW